VSYVDGKLARVKLVRANEEGKFWHTKIVRFGANQTRRIRDVYTQYVGGGIEEVRGKTGSAFSLGYILHTGSSWNGKIGRTEVAITFDRSALRNPVKSNLVLPYGGKNLAEGTILWKGPCQPKVTGHTLQFVRTHWSPRKDDDIELTYGFRYSNTGKP
jgi:hypothetical protein